MNLFLRLMIVFIKASFSRERIGILDPSVLKYRVWLTDQDMFAHMTNSRYLSFSDLGTINYIMRSGCWPILRKRGWFPVICGQSMIISRMLKTPQTFVIVTQITGWTDTYVGLSHRFLRQGREHAEVRVIARFAARDKSTVTPQAMIDAVGSDVVSPQLPQAYLDLIDDVEAGRTALRAARKST